jgi:hypothetical protein
VRRGLQGAGKREQGEQGSIGGRKMTRDASTRDASTREQTLCGVRLGFGPLLRGTLHLQVVLLPAGH